LLRRFSQTQQGSFGTQCQARFGHAGGTELADLSDAAGRRPQRRAWLRRAAQAGSEAGAGA